MIALELLENVALVVVLAIALQRLFESWAPSGWIKIGVIGGLYGLAAIAAMATPVTLAEGYFFDSRSVTLTIAGLFGGPWVAAISATIAGAFRAWLGGVGAPAGVTTIAIAAALGTLFFELRRRGLPVMKPLPLLSLGVLVHALTLLIQIYWLGDAGVAAVRQVAVPMMLLFPIGIVLVAQLVLDQQSRATMRVSLQEDAQKLEGSVNALIEVVGQMVESRDPSTAGHQRRVCQLAVAIARSMGFSADDVSMIESAALIHDVGKIAVPAEILAKPTELTSLERRLVRKHVDDGYGIVSRARLGTEIAELVRQHHERCDGSGYPRGLTGSELLPGAKILMISDVVEAMCSHRPYRPPCGPEAAMEEIRTGSGTLYDPATSAACIRVLSDGGFAFD
jgi:putative nucleotidyltransferase with HDIG domain